MSDMKGRFLRQFRFQEANTEEGRAKRQQRTNRSQGWVKVLAVLQTEHTLPGNVLPFRDCVKYRRSVAAAK